MIKKRHLLKNEVGYSTVLETLISIGISITLLAIFFYSANTLYEVQDNPESNLEAKAMGIMEALITSTGQDISQSSEWQGSGISFVGLSTNPTVEYGIVTINATTKKTTINKRYSFDPNEYGLKDTCFLAGTKVVMADGSYKNIEDIVVGDMVKCYDQTNLEIVDSVVIHVFHHHPEEMGEYYLVINDQLQVTPNHLVYSDGKWIEASDLKIGDSLFYPSADYAVESINKIFERVETFNIQVEGLHNYFVAMNDVDTLVHNDAPVARFKWFDKDGLDTGNTVFLNAGESSGTNLQYFWDWGSGTFTQDNTPPYENHSFQAGIKHNVTLKVGNPAVGYDTVTHVVEVNTVGPESDSRPWVLTGKDLWPKTDGSFSLYGEGYYILYTHKYEFPDSREMKMYEVKRLTSTIKPILDINKIGALNSVSYQSVKNTFGLEKEYGGTIMNFNISVEIKGDPLHTDPIYFGPSEPENVIAKEVTSRKVLIYYPPQITPGNNPDITRHPEYKYGEITVRIFFGGNT